MLSDYNRKLLADMNKVHSPASEKLIASHLPQTRQLYHLGFIQPLVQNGLKITKVHEVWSCDQSDFMSSYVLENVRRRAESTCEAERSFFKLCTNSLFGKTMQNVMNYCDKMRITDDKNIFLNLVFSPFFKRCFSISDTRVGIISSREMVLLDSPLYVGFSILELAKRQLWSFYYNDLTRITERSQYMELVT